MNPPFPPRRIGVHVVNRRICLDDIHQLQHGVVHQWKRSVLRALHTPHNRARVLLREKSLGHAHDDNDIKRNHQHKNGEH